MPFIRSHPPSFSTLSPPRTLRKAGQEDLERSCGALGWTAMGGRKWKGPSWVGLHIMGKSVAPNPPAKMASKPFWPAKTFHRTSPSTQAPPHSKISPRPFSAPRVPPPHVPAHCASTHLERRCWFRSPHSPTYTSLSPTFSPPSPACSPRLPACSPPKPIPRRSHRYRDSFCLV